MARLRTVKAEFWTSEQVMECSPIARLLFIGLWNFCDDGGNHPASAKTLKAEVFPGDPISPDDVQALVDELIGQRLIVEYEADNKLYWHVTGWRHQKIDKPTFKHPKPQISLALDEHSARTPRLVADPSPPERSGVERSGVDIQPSSSAEGSSQPTAGRIPDCPHQQIIDLYSKILPTMPIPRIWDGKRSDNLRARWRWLLTAKNTDGKPYATDSASGIAFFERFFGYVANSDFLSGRDGKWQGCDLAWLVKAENFAKVIEGKYENKREAA